ncbi:MAG: hypothetical protein D6767_05110 [Candidatus Hydrogenedentota bacterium]|nr:MAG: hypothetical protein D6767_05110 [Candidatus Hydrogenedentota bacterium]
MQPQLAQYIAKDNKVFDPSEYDSCLFLEIHPAMEIHRMVDLALKATRVRLGVIITERRFGQLEVHHPDQGEVREAGRAILEATGLKEDDRVRCKLTTNMVLRSIERDHGIAFTGLGKGNMIVAGDSVLIMECEPAAYMAYITNEALKAANVKLNLVTTWGATGRMILGGTEAEIDAAAEAARAAAKEVG